ncbi:MAG: diaminopimelate epimerase [Fimbriimonadales bacterium]
MNAVALPFYKVEGTGNDFVLVQETALAGVPHSLSELAPILCQRPYGIGSDGLLVLGRGMKAPVRMRMFNPDGTEDFCGNGLRCTARLAYELGYVETTEFAIETLGGHLVPAKLHLERDSVHRVEIQLPPPRFHPRDIPALIEGERLEDYPVVIAEREWRISSVNTGTTHTVLFVERLPDDTTFTTVSARLETHPLFPERTSVLWAVVESPQCIRVRIWERGVGETLGCGSGASAVAVLAQLAGWAGESVEVHSKGGVLQVQWSPERLIALTGDANLRFEGTYWLD